MSSPACRPRRARRALVSKSGQLLSNQSTDCLAISSPLTLYESGKVQCDTRSGMTNDVGLEGKGDMIGPALG